MAAQVSATGENTSAPVGPDVADRSSGSGSVSVGVGTGSQNANNSGSEDPSAGVGSAGGVGGITGSFAGSGVPLESASFGGARMKPLTGEQAAQVKRALIGRRLHFYDRLRGGHKEKDKEAGGGGGGGLKLVKSITDFAHSRRHNGSSHQLDKGLLLPTAPSPLVHYSWMCPARPLVYNVFQIGCTAHCCLPVWNARARSFANFTH